MKRPNMLDSTTAEPITEERKIEEEEEEEGRVNWAEKKRRLSAEQVKALEKGFEVENKLEPERKAKLAMDLGLHPRQVAIWFQNRRARSKTKQLERDYVVLRNDYDALRMDHDALRLNHDALLVKIKELKSKSSMGSRKVEQEEHQQNSSSNNNNNQDFVVKEQEESIALLHKDGSYDSDNSTFLSDENSSNRIEDLFPPQNDQNQPLFPTGFDKDSRESCFYYCQEQQEKEQQELLMAMKEVPSLAWNCSDEWDWEDIC